MSEHEMSDVEEEQRDRNEQEDDGEEYEEQEEDEDDDEVVDMTKFDERLVAVSDAIGHVQPPGDFFTSDERALFPMPLIVVDGVGDVSLPLNDLIAKTLIEKCHLAPYGLGEQTLVDLQNKDALVAESLVKVCRESNGALGVYLCKVRYEFEWRATEGTDYVSDEEEEDEVQDPDLTVKKELHLSGEWVGLWTGDEHTNLQMRDPAQWDDSVLGDMSTEMAPVGFFGKELDMDGDHRNMYMGNEGSVVEKWYNSAALVVLPLVLRYKLSFAANPEETLKSWANLVDTKPYFARVAAEEMLVDSIGG
ncbi:hypothetical protein Poli38472_007432 [Pythium oligandrum]|uniref:Uncharacterized protein n=1 Tax=Pythium oligandrum TaxID=41045 RepID=A0A8K1CS65_PYTOL|nr:hypothetical protein Poli38472_007432 [Pythium oligandrum]|eukprot:TMW67760.1 hypothetical protein Poli38472_007432 [Pythium oligandrum]